VSSRRLPNRCTTGFSYINDSFAIGPVGLNAQPADKPSVDVVQPADFAIRVPAKVRIDGDADYLGSV